MNISKKHPQEPYGRISSVYPTEPSTHRRNLTATQTNTWGLSLHTSTGILIKFLCLLLLYVLSSPFLAEDAFARLVGMLQYTFHHFVRCAVKIRMWYEVPKNPSEKRTEKGARLLQDVGWNYDLGWDYCRMWVENIGGCGVRLLHDVEWDYCMMWCEIIAWCGVRLLEDVAWDYCRRWGEIIAGCWVRLLEDVWWD